MGVTRQLSFNPRILNNRGYIVPGSKNDKGTNMANMLTPAEILTPFAGTHDQWSFMIAISCLNFLNC